MSKMSRLSRFDTTHMKNEPSQPNFFSKLSSNQRLFCVFDYFEDKFADKFVDKFMYMDFNFLKIWPKCGPKTC